jgi:beta-galactosidase
MSTFIKNSNMRQLFVLFCVFTAVVSAKCQYKFNDILYGVAYYHEYMPYERLEEDVRLMQEAGINFVRLGESTWQLWEPRDGEFQYEWMDRVVDRMHKAGIKVIMGTPTYSIPAWLYRKHPEITITLENGDKLKYGIRQNVDLTHPVYLHYSQRVIERIVQHYKNHPAVIGYQIDNETHSKGVSDKHVHLSFVDHLKKKFGSVDKLNKAWGFNYWGQAITEWDELHPAAGFNHPGYKLEWIRYQQKIVHDFLEWQAELVRKNKGEIQFVMHDFAGAPKTDADLYEISKFLDFAGTNIYHYDQDRSDGLRISLQGDFTRSLKRDNYLVPETNCQAIGWNSAMQFPPYDGQLRLNYYTHVGTGANMVAYWHWHSLHNGIEQYWRGVLPHDLKPGRTYREVKRIGEERTKHGRALVNLKRQNKVAILYSIDSDNALQLQPFDNNFHGVSTGPWDSNNAYQKVMNTFYKELYDLNIGVDFVFPDGKNFDQYDVIVVPPLYISTDTLLNALAAYAEGGGNLILNFKTGFCDQNSSVRHDVMPGKLSSAAGITYNEFSTLKEKIGLKDDPFKSGPENYAEQWVEFITPVSAKPLAYYDHPFFGKYAAVTRNSFGKGSVTYIGTVLSGPASKAILMNDLKSKNLLGSDQTLPKEIKVKHAVSNRGKKLHFYYNYSDSSKTFVYAYPAGRSMLENVDVSANASKEIGAWGVIIIEEK